ncbi:MAG: hypothetical protein AMJ45_00240 [Syntrophobacter sp. DG_60]|nr:MAG: hypothetical protein AMJ45_00240 [Syntrophobacter sp. DG_60]
MKVLLIEDSPEIVNTLSLTFKLHWPEATLASTDKGAEGIKMVETESPDIVILDINLPDMSGFKVLEDIREEVIDKVRGLETGADDYITKPFDPLDFLARVKAVLRRTGIYYPEDEELPPLVAGNLTINFFTRKVLLGDQQVHLTPTEYKVLHCLARNEGRIVTQETLRRRVWGSARYVDASALKKYIYQLRTKLGDTSRPPRIILSERGVGYKFVKPK